MIILGSKSPRRKEILEKFNIPFKIYLKDVVEDVSEKDPKEYAMKTALKKGLSISLDFPNETVLCADTIVTIDNKILGKPKDKNDAYKMIDSIQGKSHKVITGVYLGSLNNYELFCEETIVNIKKMTPEEILEYINTNEPYDKAGAYAIQGIFHKYVDQIEGSYYNVVGLPIERIIKKLGE